MLSFIKNLTQTVNPKVNDDLSIAVKERNAERVKQLLESESHLLQHRSESDLSKYDGRFHPKAKKRLLKATSYLAYDVQLQAKNINDFRRIAPDAQVLKDLDILVMLLNSKDELAEHVYENFPLAHAAVNELTLGLHLFCPDPDARLDPVVSLDSWNSYIPNFFKSTSENAEDLAEKGYDPAFYRTRVINV